MRNCPTLLYDICLADAYGAGFEYVEDHLHFNRNTLEGFVPHPKFKNLEPGYYTDDGQMSVAVAEALCSAKEKTEELFIWWFLEAFRRDPRHGYSKGFYPNLAELTIKDGLRITQITDKVVAAFKSLIKPNSKKSGAAMRSVPLGVIDDLPLTLELAKLQAQVTHGSSIGVWSSQFVATLAHFAFYSGEPFSPAALSAHLIQAGIYQPFIDAPFHGRAEAENDLVETLRAVYWLLTTCENRIELLKKAVELGGDTDTTAAIAFGIASIRDQTPIPQQLRRNFEPGPFGEDFLLSLGERLMTLRMVPRITYLYSNNPP